MRTIYAEGGSRCASPRPERISNAYIELVITHGVEEDSLELD
jgi:hypothetical protein